MKAMVGLVIAILIIFSLNLFWPSNQTDVNNVTVEENTNQQDTIKVEVEESEVEDDSALQTLNTPSDDEKIELMTSEYEILEKERKQLKRRLARLKHDMWGLKFAREDAKQMSEIMLNATRLIKNPDMLGAFHSIEGIQDEITKIKFAEKSLEQIDAMIEQNKNNANTVDEN